MRRTGTEDKRVRRTDEKLDLIAEEYKEENLIFAKEGLEINI